MALVIVLNEAGVFSAKLGGITGPGSRPKKDRNRAFLITGGTYYDSMGRIEGQRPDCPGNR